MDTGGRLPHVGPAQLVGPLVLPGRERLAHRRLRVEADPRDRVDGFFRAVAHRVGDVVLHTPSAGEVPPGSRRPLFTSLLANLVIFHDTLDIADVGRELQAEGRVVDPLDLGRISPCLTEHIKWCGEYSTHELALTPDAYDAHPDVGFSMLGDDDAAT